MGYSRPRPKHLAAKLLQIRHDLGISQTEMAKRLGVERYNDISKYELDKNEPPLMVLLTYSRVSNIPLPNIIDDDLNLKQLDHQDPNNKKHDPHKTASD